MEEAGGVRGVHGQLVAGERGLHHGGLQALRGVQRTRTRGCKVARDLRQLRGLLHTLHEAPHASQRGGDAALATGEVGSEHGLELVQERQQPLGVDGGARALVVGRHRRRRRRPSAALALATGHLRLRVRLRLGHLLIMRQRRQPGKLAGRLLLLLLAVRVEAKAARELGDARAQRVLRAGAQEQRGTAAAAARRVQRSREEPL